MLAPLGYKVLIKPDPIGETNKFGDMVAKGSDIVIPKTAGERAQKAARTGTLIRKGPSASHGIEYVPDGARVVITKYTGAEVKEFDGDEEYWIVNDEDVSAWDMPEGWTPPQTEEK